MLDDGLCAVVEFFCAANSRVNPVRCNCMRIDFTQPFDSDEPGTGAGDGLSHIEPTDLITLWPGENAPTLQEVLAALKAHRGGEIEVIGEPPPELCRHIAGEGEPIWAAIVQLPAVDDFPVPLVLWAEPMREMGAETVRQLKAEAIKWAVGVETILWPEDPLGHFVKLLRLLGRAVPNSPGILDVNKEGWHTREELDQSLLRDDVEISESILWFIHAAGKDSPPNESSKIWIYTHGLSRCDRPELEMLEVPFPLVGSAIALVNAVAEQIVENDVPEPGQPFEISDGLAVTLQPWREAAEHADATSPGHAKNRLDHEQRELIDNRVAICGATPTGTYRKIWTWPSEVVQELARRGPTALFKTRRAAVRQKQMARETWGELMQAFATLPAEVRQKTDDRAAVFLIQAGLQKPNRNGAKSYDAHENNREELWFEVKRFHGEAGGRIEAELVNEPFDLPHLHQGDVLQIDASTVCDWQVLTKKGHFGPGTAGGLLEAVTQIRETVRR